MSATNGVLIVTAGSRTAYWDGLEIRLGFNPQMIDGQIFVHALDVRKNFEPLLRGFEFPSVSHGMEAIRAVMQRGLRPAVMRLTHRPETR